MTKKMKRAGGTLEVDGGTLVARRGGRTARAELDADGLRGHLADSLRKGGGLRWGDVAVRAPAAAGVAEVTVGGNGGVTVPLDRAEAGALAERVDPPTKNPDEPYILYRETNNWEMERWRFYIPLRGNEAAVKALLDAARRLEPEDGCFLGRHVRYDIRAIPVPESEVDRLCRRGRCRGYMATHNKLEGRLDLRKAKAAAAGMGGEDDILYKGGVRGLMGPWGRRGRPAEADWPTGRHVAAAKRMRLRDLHAATAGTLLKAAGRDAPRGFGLGGASRQMSFGERCWEAVGRLRSAGMRTAGDIARLTRRELLALPGVGRETANQAGWMLRDLGLDFAKR